ncbi:hypothetical protein Glove_26g83 [Diversispora epigaea]|uniref:C2H2-type domain-containing protein n=1 Tax=Diversispora epigaea TaxID=1348612 RepID=A0A397JLG2_9GLOM|nr:hypothetical protein Glove_26g83 [Diversispora epigaea]
MSTSYKCPYCNVRYFSNRNSYSQHVNRCINLYDVSTEESNTEVSEVTDMLLDNDDFNRIEERQSIQEIENLPSGSEITDLFEYGDYDADVSVSLEVISNIPERFEEILSESSRNKDSDVENLQNEDSNIEHLQNENLDVRSESSRKEDSDVEEFPNESYADLMTLVTKYNLNNKAGNAIIKFFNKHSNLSISPLPKNIETGRKKSFIKSRNFLAFCIENEQLYGKQYTGNWWKKAKESIPSVAYILSIILYSDATTTDTLVSKENLNNTRLRDDQMVLRNKENMLQYYNNEERQSIQEIENLPSGSEITDLFEYGDYDADVSVSLEVISNIPERFEEILSESSRNKDSDVENLQNEDSNIEHLQNENLDVRSESSRKEDSDVEEFPNESYADLMTLVTKYNLNNKAGNAIIKFFNKHSNLSISPLPKNIETGRKKSFIKSRNFLAFCIENEQLYGKQYTGNWWKKAKESIPSVAYILSIILYSDATTTDTLGKGSLHPIYISLVNIPTWRRNKDAKQLLGYLLILSAKDEREKKSSEFKKLVRKTFHNSIKFLLEQIMMMMVMALN